MATSTSTHHNAPHSVPIVILGTDAVIAALPATAVQLAHACLRAGFTNVIPASWGDELIASATLRRLEEIGEGPVIACSCPIVAHRLLSASADLRPVLLPFVPPPVAVARYVRHLARPNRARVTYVGNCPGAIDDSIDIRMTPDALIAMLAERQIVLEDQPRVFESIIPADRRRYRSQPGGLPAAEAVWSASAGSRLLVEVLDSEDLASEIAQHVLAGENVLIDAAAALGCVCSGAVRGVEPEDARAAVVAHEPPRAPAAIIDELTPIQLDMRVPAASRTPVDVMAVPSIPTPTYAMLATRGTSAPSISHASPPLGIATIPGPGTAPVGEGVVTSHPTQGEIPTARQIDGKDRKTLPRSYIVRRRPSPRSTPVVPDRGPIQRETPRVPADVKEVKDLPQSPAKNGTEKRERPGHRDVQLVEPHRQPEPVAPAAESARRTEGPGLVLESSERSSTELSVARETSSPIKGTIAPSTDEGSRTRERESDSMSTTRGDQPKRFEPPVVARLTHATPVEPPKLSRVTFTSPPPDIEPLYPDAVDDSTSMPSSVMQALSPFQVRHVVLFLLAVVGLAIAVSAVVAVMVERKFSAPPVTAPTPNNDR